MAPNHGQSICDACQPGSYSVGLGNANCTLCNPGYYNQETEANTCEVCTEGRAANASGATVCDACGHGKYADTKAATECKDCPAGKIQTQEVGTACTPCTPGRSTNNVVGSTAEFCPECEVHWYCDRFGCGECNECTIAEYTDGTGATKAEKCMTFGAVFGFKYPSQCSIIWIIFAGIVLLCCGGWGTKWYVAHKSGQLRTTVQEKDPEGEQPKEKESGAKEPEGILPNSGNAEKSSLLAFVF